MIAAKNLIFITLLFISTHISGMFKDESDNEGEGIEDSEIIIEEETTIEPLKTLVLNKIVKEFLNCLHTGEDSEWLTSKNLPIDLEKEIKEILWKQEPALLIKILSYQVMSNLINQKRTIHALAITPDNNFIIAATDREIITADIKTGEIVNICEIEHKISNSSYVNTVYDPKLLNKMAISNDGTLVAGFTNTTLKIWSAESGICLHSIDTRSQILSAIFDQNNNVITLNLKIVHGKWDCAYEDEINRLTRKDLYDFHIHERMFPPPKGWSNKHDWQAINMWDLSSKKHIYQYKQDCRKSRIIKIISHNNKLYAFCRKGNNRVHHLYYYNNSNEITKTKYYPMNIKHDDGDSGYAYNAGYKRHNCYQLDYELFKICPAKKIIAKWSVENNNASSNVIFYKTRPYIISLTIDSFHPLSLKPKKFSTPFNEFEKKGGLFPNRTHGGVMLSDDSIVFINNNGTLEIWDVNNAEKITLLDKIKIGNIREVIISKNNSYIALRRANKILILQMLDLDKLSLAEILLKRKEKEEKITNSKKSNCILA